MADHFGMPDIEVSWDNGRNWQPYVGAVGKNCLTRIRTPDGEYLEKCGGCDGTGKARRLRFVEDKPWEN